MGQQSCKRINFEDMQYVTKNSQHFLIINTLSKNNQQCLILNTASINLEEQIVNKLVLDNKLKNIIVYGANCNDEMVLKKHNQLITLGFTNVFIYNGGLFEWLLLQDVYGFENFPTNNVEFDILKYKPVQLFNFNLLENNT